MRSLAASPPVLGLAENCKEVPSPVERGMPSLPAERQRYSAQLEICTNSSRRLRLRPARTAAGRPSGVCPHMDICERAPSRSLRRKEAAAEFRAAVKIPCSTFADSERSAQCQKEKPRRPDPQHPTAPSRTERLRRCEQR